MIDLAARPVAPRAAALLTIDVEDWYHVNYRSWRASSDAPVRRGGLTQTDRTLAIAPHLPLASFAVTDMIVAAVRVTQLSEQSLNGI